MSRKDTTAAGRILSDLEWLAADERGRRILWRLWQSTGVFGPAVSDNSLQAFAEGRRSVGLEYWQAVVSLSPTAAALALTEHSAGANGDGRTSREQPDTDDQQRRDLLERWSDLAGPGRGGVEPGSA